MIEVLSVTSELYPLIKTGGLADVAGALPGALSGHDVHMRTLLPGYPAVMKAAKGGRKIASFDDLWGGKARLIAAKSAGLDLIVLDAPHLYDRPGGPYQDKSHKDWPDNWARFAALSWAAAEIARGLISGYKPPIIHAHDWTSALAPAYVVFGAPNPARTVVTIHNLAFQGHFPAAIFPELKLPAQAFSVDGIEYYGGVGFLKAGLRLADAITTVSPTYAKEIRGHEAGMGLDGLLNERVDSLTGILNGIDTAQWDPGTDERLVQTYRAGTPHLRTANKRALEERFGLEESDDMLFGVVSRLTWQKGMDLLADCVDSLVDQGARLCVLGSGDTGLETRLSEAAARHPGRVGLQIGYDEDLSHLMQGGADAILIPSRFEPCGLTQLYGLRYGCIPVVARVGGLADTIIDANEVALASGVATGVQFTPVNAGEFDEGIRRAVALYGQRRVWAKMQRRGMKTDVSWDASASRYAALYRDLMGQTGSNGD